MKALVKKIKSEKRDISIQLPGNFINKNIRVTIEIDDNETEKILMADKIKIDTKKWKFRREEIYE